MKQTEKNIWAFLLRQDHVDTFQNFNAWIFILLSTESTNKRTLFKKTFSLNFKIVRCFGCKQLFFRQFWQHALIMLWSFECFRAKQTTSDFSGRYRGSGETIHLPTICGWHAVEKQPPNNLWSIHVHPSIEYNHVNWRSLQVYGMGSIKVLGK